MLTGAHFLLTYTCNYECEHCFVFSSPQAQGTFSIGQLQTALEELTKVGSITRVYFEGGEAFLYYPLMVEGISLAREKGFEAGIVTNAYWATTESDAELWLKPLWELGIADLSLSEDTFHSGDVDKSPARNAYAAATKMGIPVGTISIERPRTVITEGIDHDAGEPIVGGSTMFRGRAVETLLEGLPTKPWQDFTECAHEDLSNPKRVHLDSYGNVHLCQGISIGNMWQTPLSELIRGYDCDLHPIAGPIMRGGPAMLAEVYGIGQDKYYVDACHLCFNMRLDLLDRFQQYLAPRQVYGVTG
ncbi:radical SAM protein [Chloroflexota bacterium]